MDAFCNSSIVEIIKQFDNLESQIIHNTHKLKEGSKIIIKEYTKTNQDKEKVIKTILYHAQRGE